MFPGVGLPGMTRRYTSGVLPRTWYWFIDTCLVYGVVYWPKTTPGAVAARVIHVYLTCVYCMQCTCALPVPPVALVLLVLLVLLSVA